MKHTFAWVFLVNVSAEIDRLAYVAGSRVVALDWNRYSFCLLFHCRAPLGFNGRVHATLEKKNRKGYRRLTQDQSWPKWLAEDCGHTQRRAIGSTPPYLIVLIHQLGERQNRGHLDDQKAKDKR